MDRVVVYVERGSDGMPLGWFYKLNSSLNTKAEKVGPFRHRADAIFAVEAQFPTVKWRRRSVYRRFHNSVFGDL